MKDEPMLTLPNSDRRVLVRAATRLLGPADAEDAVQDAYVRALEADQLNTLNSAQAWLLTVVRNLAIDRLRRRHWMQQWLAEMNTGDTVQASPSAEMDVALAQEAARALRLLSACLAPEDGAAVLLHAVFEVGHADIAQASGRSEASSRQQLRRALLRLRQTGGVPEDSPHPAHAQREETVFRLYLQSLQLRDPQALWAMLRHAPISAVTRMSADAATANVATSTATATPHALTSGVVQMGGQLGLVLTLDGVRLCVVPLGVHIEHEYQIGG